MNTDAKMAAVKARWVNASESLSRVGTAQADHQSQTASKLMGCGEDVPFLLEQLEQAQGELNKAIAHLDRCAWARNTIDLNAGPLEIQLATALTKLAASEATAAMLSKSVERLKAETAKDIHAIEEWQAQAAASEAAAGQMRAALEKVKGGDWQHGENCPRTVDCEEADPGDCLSHEEGEACPACDCGADDFNAAVDLAQAALATTAGRGWLSPEEAERLRKELEQARIQTPIWKTATGRSVLERNGFVSEEECARRCREVVRRWDDFCNPDMRISYVPETEAELLAIIDRVAKGGAR